MAKYIAPQFVEELQNRVDITDLINKRVPLKKAGANYQACCPFHNEKTPSFSVSPSKQFYYCFGCQASGNAIDFMMNFDHLTFVDAVENIAAEVGMTVEYEQLSREEVRKFEHRQTLDELMSQTAQLFEKNLYHGVGEQAKKYLSERQLDKETALFFHLGYAQNGNNLQNHFGNSSNVRDDLQRVGLLGKGDNGYYDFFRNRLMFPIRDVRGRVVGFGARALGDAKPKYLNTGETELFNKSHILYGLYEELQTNRNIEHLIVVEGYMDVIALHQMGIKGAVAALGTSFTEGHLQLVKKYTKKIFFCFDGDNAGKKAAYRSVEKILPVMTTDTQVRMVFLPDGEDPDTLVRKIGREEFTQLLEQGLYLSQFICETIIGDSDINLTEGRGAMMKRAKELLDSVPYNSYKKEVVADLNAKTGHQLYAQSEESVNSNGNNGNGIAVVPTSPSATHDSFTPYKKKRSAKYIAMPQIKGGWASPLIRRLLICPDLAQYITNEDLLAQSGDADTELLYRLIQCLQVHHIDIDKPVEQYEELIISYFDGNLAVRLKDILCDEKIANIPTESVEQRRNRLTQEFLTGFVKKLNEIQEKIARLS